MKVFILACLVALALAREKEAVSESSETSESISSIKESIEYINEKLQNVKPMALQVEDVLQDKVHPFIQSQPQTFPYVQPISCIPLAQNAVPIAQPSVVPPLGPVTSPELEAALKAKVTILPKHEKMTFLNPETVLSLLNNPQIHNLADLVNQHLPQSLVQPLAQPVLKAFLQTPVVSSQPQLTIPQSKVLYLLQQAAPFVQADMPAQALQQYLELLLNPILQFPATQSSHPITV